MEEKDRIKNGRKLQPKSQVCIANHDLVSAGKICPEQRLRELVLADRLVKEHKTKQIGNNLTYQIESMLS